MNASNGNNPNENNSTISRLNNQRKGKGRQKLKMEKIKKESNLQVTFSKRRAGIFKKASELSTLCGAESTVVVFSPGRKAQSFGHPDVETITNRFQNNNDRHAPLANPLISAHHVANNRQLNHELIYKEGLLEKERQRKRELDHLPQPRINELDYEELNKLHKSLKTFKSVFESRFKDATNLGGSTNVQGPNPEQLGDLSVGFDTKGYPNAGGSTQWAGGSTSSYPAPFDPNMGYMVQYPYGAGGSDHGASGSGDSGGLGGTGGAVGFNVLMPYNFSNPSGEVLFRDTMTTTSKMEAEDEAQTNVSNMSRGQGSRWNNGHGGCS
ncbi:hypothetical protein ACS0TY_032451 [Phlomoides rotata]